MTEPFTLHEDLLPLGWLVGRWVGIGSGQYPTIEQFRFEQWISFSSDGRPFLSYSSVTWLLDEEGARVKPLATEAGFWRPQPDNRVEVTLSHPTGYAELWSGTQTVSAIENARVTSAHIELRTDAVARTLTAKEYTEGHRLYVLRNEELHWTFDMAAMGEPLSNHLAVSLQRADVQPEGSRPEDES